MATSSFDRDFIISDEKEVEKLIFAMENPVKIKLPEQKKTADKEKVLWAIKQRIRSPNS